MIPHDHMTRKFGLAWMDEDGKHIWWAHICADGQEHREMLPSTWKNVEGKVAPSIVCTVSGCNYHAFPLIETEPTR